MPSNSAAWLVAEKKKPLEVRPAPYTSPGAHEIVIKNRAVAINPVDRIMQELAWFPLNYPAIIGHDVAGEVVEVGDLVTRFRIGDRVLGHGIGMVTQRDCDSTFQEYTVLKDYMSSQIPTTTSFEAAAVVPLGFSTAACGMYEKNSLELPFPTVNPEPTGEVLLVWGGATSVGSNGIQLGVSSGYEVITTASPKNFDYVRKIGASQVFDYKSDNIVEELVNELKGKTIAGVLDCISANGAVEVCAEVLRQSEGRKFISTVIKAADELPGGIKTHLIFGIIKEEEVAKAVYEHYLPKALADGKFVPAPDPLVIGKGLHAIQDGMEAQKTVSAKKIVITL